MICYKTKESVQSQVCLKHCQVSTQSPAPALFGLNKKAILGAQEPCHYAYYEN